MSEEQKSVERYLQSVVKELEGMTEHGEIRARLKTRQRAPNERLGTEAGVVFELDVFVEE